MSNTIAWSLCPNGKFKVGSFRRCLEDQSTDIDMNSKLVWQGISPPKVEVFAWQLCKGRIMVKNVLSRFGVSQNLCVLCLLCSEGIESIDHLFFCSALGRGSYGMGVCDGGSCCNSSLADWWQGWTGLCPSSNRTRVWSTLFLAVVWSIWEARNKAVFENEKAHYLPVLDMVMFRVAWWFKHHGKRCTDDITIILLDINQRCVDHLNVRRNSVSEWKPPSSDVLLFNVDGLSKGEPVMAGIGGVLRNSTGRTLGKFSYFVGNQDAITAELLAIRKACSLVASNHFFLKHKVTIASDSKVAVAWINDKNFGSLKHMDLLYEIQSFLNSLEGVVVKFSPGEMNSLADRMAKLSSTSKIDRLEWDVF
ncbi:hypothetical protein Dsin_014360 [Dipteronia sinensis]|uniref:RNase H type-1 domain-containing protein n=1 Tax=Dipteronia sinensis TaxID=43782 RepID=A0AAE0EBH6_9ROSI|nr:hypothetical protein Dsin_014360 [Dipteronia sinensis]